jgi:hypothetical protein
MKKLLKIIVYPISFLFGSILFIFTKRTPTLTYQALRFLFVKTNGRFNDMLSSLISVVFPKYNIKDANGLLGNLSFKDIEFFSNEIKENGFYIFKQKLTESQISDILNFASTTPVKYLDYNREKFTFSEKGEIFDSKNVKSPKYEFEPHQMIKNDTLKDLIFDKSLMAVANGYLNSKPILDLIAMWWSVPFSSEAASKAAQLYHFDMDRIKFLKFFFYLTDVNTENGPHCYVRNSHKRLPKEILRDGRLQDDEVKKYFNEEDIIEICAPKGSIIAVDTRGLHKGKILTNGSRLLLQFQFSNSLFGAPYPNLLTQGNEGVFKELKEKYPRTYQLFYE